MPDKRWGARYALAIFIGVYFVGALLMFNIVRHELDIIARSLLAAEANKKVCPNNLATTARSKKMKEHEVRERAFAMPLTSPAYPVGPYRFYHREFFIITYRTDPRKLREVVPQPLEVDEPLVKFEFIRMPDSTGFGDYTESGQVIPVSFKGRKGGYSHCMFLNDHPPIAGGRELWGFPKKLAEPTLKAEIDTLVGRLHYGTLPIAIGTMGYKHKQADLAAVKASLLAPNFLLKIIPHVDGTARICELVEYYLSDVDLKGAWTGPTELTLFSHALAPLAELPVLEIVSGTHIIADLTLELGKVVHDYLA
jgi:acetoacetate decarboxylase